jgi:hypothetical protein
MMENSADAMVKDPLTSRSNARRAAISVFAIAVLVEIVFLALLPNAFRPNEASDYDVFYRPVAQNIVEHKGLTINGEFAARFPPGFPAYLAAQFYLADRLGVSRNSLILTTNVLAGALSAVLLLLVARLIFPPKIALISALLWATYPFDLWLIKQPNSEVPFVLTLYLSIWFFVRVLKMGGLSQTAFVGLLLALVGLIRPIAGLAPLVMSLIVMLKREMTFTRRLGIVGVLLGTFGIAISPWMVELHSHTGHFALLSTGGPPSIADGLTFAAKPSGSSAAGPAPSDVVALANRIQSIQQSPQSLSDIVTVMAAQLRNDPVPVVELFLLKMARSWYGTDALRYERVIGATQCFYFFWILPGIWLAWKAFPCQRLELCLFLLLVLYFWGMTVVALSILRYMVPVMGLLMMFGAVAMDKFLGWGSQKIAMQISY